MTAPLTVEQEFCVREIVRETMLAAARCEAARFQAARAADIEAALEDTLVV